MFEASRIAYLAGRELLLQPAFARFGAEPALSEETIA